METPRRKLRAKPTLTIGHITEAKQDRLREKSNYGNLRGVQTRLAGTKRTEAPMGCNPMSTLRLIRRSSTITSPLKQPAVSNPQKPGENCLQRPWYELGNRDFNATRLLLDWQPLEGNAKVRASISTGWWGQIRYAGRRRQFEGYSPARNPGWISGSDCGTQYAPGRAPE